MDQLLAFNDRLMAALSPLALAVLAVLLLLLGLVLCVLGFNRAAQYDRALRRAALASDLHSADTQPLTGAAILRSDPLLRYLIPGVIALSLGSDLIVIALFTW